MSGPDHLQRFDRERATLRRGATSIGGLGAMSGPHEKWSTSRRGRQGRDRRAARGAATRARVERCGGDAPGARRLWARLPTQLRGVTVEKAAVNAVMRAAAEYLPVADRRRGVACDPASTCTAWRPRRYFAAPLIVVKRAGRSASTSMLVRRSAPASRERDARPCAALADDQRRRRPAGRDLRCRRSPSGRYTYASASTRKPAVAPYHVARGCRPAERGDALRR